MATKGVMRTMHYQGGVKSVGARRSSSSSSSSRISGEAAARRGAAREKYLVARWMSRMSLGKHHLNHNHSGSGSGSVVRHKRQHHLLVGRRSVHLYSSAAQAHGHAHAHDDHTHEVKSGEVSLDAWVEGLKWDDKGFVVAIAQDVDTGAVLMQAFANREAVKATVKTKLGTFYSRSRKSLWCKGESSGNLLHVKGVYADCDGDSLIYLCKPVGPACHTGAPTCWFESVSSVRVDPGSDSDSADMVHLSRETPYGTLQVLENTIQARQDEISANNEKPSWTAKLLTDEALLLSKVREEAGELCETLERNEGKERTASEMADLLYHAMVLLRTQDVDLAQVLEILRGRFAISGIEEKAARPPKK